MKKAGNKLWKITLSVLGLLVLGLVTWANWNSPTITERLEKVNMISFDLSGLKDTLQIRNVSEQLQKLDGVSASTVSYSAKMGSVVFYQERMSTQRLGQLFAQWTGTPLKLVQFPQSSGGCPVHGISAFFGKLKERLRFRS